MYVSPAIMEAIRVLENTDPAPDRRRRLKTYRGALMRVGTDRLFHPGPWWREPSGRIHCPGQNIAKGLRGHFRPSDPERDFVDADLTGAHVAIAASRSGDAALIAATTAGVCYENLAALLPSLDPEAARGIAKHVAATLINGGTERAIMNQLVGKVADPRSAACALMNGFWRAYPRLRWYIEGVMIAVRAAAARGAKTFDVPTLSGPVPIPISRGRERTALSAHWSTVEAQALDFVLCHLHDRIGGLGGRLVLPMFDGLLVDAPSPLAGRVEEALEALIVEALHSVDLGGR